MTDFLRVFLPLYFIIYFGITFVVKTLAVSRKTGKNPLVLPKDDSAYGLIGRYFKLTLITIFVYVMVYAFFPALRVHFLPIPPLNHPEIILAGLFLMLISLVWTIVAQSNMKNSWRIGVDRENRTPLVTTGLFSVSRNPVFLGMTLSLAGLVLTTPNALTGLFLVLGHVLIQIQIRLEEDFLTAAHGQQYLDYKQRVRRMI